MISDIASFLRYFDGIHRRTLRDVSALPIEAETWMPPEAEDEEGSWGVPQIVRHIAEARGFFANAFRGEGWIWSDWPDALQGRDTWAPALEQSSRDLTASLEAVPEERLQSRVELIGEADRKASGWRLLLMMVEHEIHHRSQLATYAGLNGWQVHQLFGRTNEWVVSRREGEARKAGR